MPTTKYEILIGDAVFATTFSESHLDSYKRYLETKFPTVKYIVKSTKLV